VQHIAFVGTDQQLHEAFIPIGDGSWTTVTPSSVQVAPGTSPTSWYTYRDNIQHVAFAGADLQLHEMFFRLSGLSFRFVGFHCFGETDEPSASDEPYFTFGSVAALSGVNRVEQTTIWENVDAGESKHEIIELYRGAPVDLALSITLSEHDEGDPDKFKENVEIAVDKASEKIVHGLAGITVFGPLLAITAEVLLVIALPAISEAVNDLLGTEDDFVGNVEMVIAGEDLRQLAFSPRKTFAGVEHHFESPLISGDGASYKAYFDVVVNE
jgi:hypothetical protein